MFPNLEAEMARNRVSKVDLSKHLGIRYATVIDKTKGKSRFTLDEAMKIKKRYFPQCSIEYLFACESQETA